MNTSAQIETAYPPTYFTNIERVKKISSSTYIINSFLLYMLSGALLYLVADEQDIQNNSAAASAVKYFWLMLYAVMIYYFTKKYYVLFKNIRKNSFLILLSVVAVLSIVWSQAPEVTSRRLVSFIASLLYAFYISEYFKQQNILKLFFYLTCMIVISSYIMIILVPEHGIATGVHQGAWQGVYFHKNGLGRIAGLCLISTILYYKQVSGNKFFIAVIGILCLILLMMSKSTTTQIAFLVMLPAYIVLNWAYKNYQKSRLVILIIVGIIVTQFLISFIIEGSETAYSAIGKDDSFTGRLPLWVMLIDYINQSPMVGYGYSAFWIPKFLSKTLWVDSDWNPEQGHNGFIDITLELGLIGLTLFSVVLLKAYKRSLNFIKNTTQYHSYWYILILIFLTIVSFTESFLLKYNNVYWVMFLICSISIAPSSKNSHFKNES
ncbi:O-antigen ligase family protein [Larkinella sp. GY13]|uniref:O-antigen ligase family protein n=1 Tax=Larkinella sp. GY13 TaxID=3453720 RepID=UPI003EEBB066